MEHPTVYKDGYRFLRGDTNNIVGQLTGSYRLPEDFSSRWRSLLASRKASIADCGAGYYFAIAPNKESVAREKLPDDMTLAEVQPRDHVIRAAYEAGVPVIFPVDRLRQCHHAGEQVYSPGDTHWGSPGAFVMYEEIARTVGFDAIGRDEVSFVAISGTGDLAGKIGQRTTRVVHRLHRRSAAKVFDNEIPITGNRIRYSNPNRRGRCLVFRDSFFNHLTPFFAETFADVEIVWQPNIEMQIVDDFRPDVVLSLQAERFLVAVPDDEVMQSNAARVALKA